MATILWDKSKHDPTFNVPLCDFYQSCFSPDFPSHSDPSNLSIGGRQGGLQVEHNFLSRYQNISDFLDTTGL